MANIRSPVVLRDECELQACPCAPADTAIPDQPTEVRRLPLIARPYLRVQEAVCVAEDPQARSPARWVPAGQAGRRSTDSPDAGPRRGGVGHLPSWPRRIRRARRDAPFVVEVDCPGWAICVSPDRPAPVTFVILAALPRVGSQRGSRWSDPDGPHGEIGLSMLHHPTWSAVTGRPRSCGKHARSAGTPSPARPDSRRRRPGPTGRAALGPEISRARRGSSPPLRRRSAGGSRPAAAGRSRGRCRRTAGWPRG